MELAECLLKAGVDQGGEAVA